MASGVEAPRGTPPSTGGRLTEDELLSALPARSANREVRVGLFVLLGVAAFLIALFTFTDVGTFRGRYYVTTSVPDAGGVRRGDPVQMRGVNIGRVVGFGMVPEGVEIRLELYDEYDVPEGSVAHLKSSGLLGGMTVDIIPGLSEANVDDGDTLPGTSAEGLFSAAETLGVEADTVLARIQTLLSPRTIGAVGESATEMQSLLVELRGMTARQRVELAELSGSLRRSAVGLEGVTTGPELARAVARIDSLTVRLNTTTASLDVAARSLDTVLGRMERGEGTLGMLSTNDDLYINLNTAAASLNELIVDIRANPGRYLDIGIF
jgi:phospholipid/cholesterol/gamma-HCH transport system substrate-binding protein